MGPRSCDRGSQNVRHGASGRHHSLQWGRGHVTAEVCLRAGDGVELLSLQWGRGHVTAEVITFPAEPPSWSPGFNGAAVM